MDGPLPWLDLVIVFCRRPITNRQHPAIIAEPRCHRDNSKQFTTAGRECATLNLLQHDPFFCGRQLLEPNLLRSQWGSYRKVIGLPSLWPAVVGDDETPEGIVLQIAVETVGLTTSLFLRIQGENEA